jgi:hypothetical protein
MAVKTSTISVRLPENFITELKGYCKVNNQTVSDVMKAGFAQTQEIGLFTAPAPNKNLNKYLTQVAGGSLVGILVYRWIYGGLKSKYSEKFTDEEINILSTAGALCCSLITALGINELFKENK